MKANHYLDVLFPGDEGPAEDHPCWNTLESRDFKVLINFMILNKLSSIVENQPDIHDLVELRTYAKILHTPKIMKEFYHKEEIPSNPSSNIENFE